MDYLDYRPEITYSILNPTQTITKLLPAVSEGLLGPSGRGDHNSQANIKLRQDEVLDSLKKYYPDNPNAWAGFMGNIAGENSKFDFQREETEDVENKGYGLFQFTATQRRDYFQYLLDTGKEDSVDAQVGYVHHLIYDENPTREIGDQKRDRIRQNINTGTAYDISDSLVKEYEIPPNIPRKQEMRRGLTSQFMDGYDIPMQREKPAPIKPYSVYRNRPIKM